MKMRKKLAALLAAAMIASVMPMTAFAVSTNTVTNTVSYEKETPLKGDMAPKVKLEIKDDMTSGQAFYLNLENAEWLKVAPLMDEFGGRNLQGNSFDVDAADVTDGNNTGVFTFTRTGSKSLRVAFTGMDALARKTFIEIPLYTVLKDGEAAISVDGGSSIVSNSKHVFATSSKKGEASIKVGDADSFAEEGDMATITFDEPFIGAFAANMGDTATILVELRDSDFKFVKKQSKDADGKVIPGQYDSVAKGMRGFSNVSGISADIKSGSTDTIEIKVTKADITGIKERGAIELKDFQIARKDRNAAKGDVSVRISSTDSDLISGKPSFVVAKHDEHGTKLVDEAKETEVVMAGEEVEVEFTLAEVIEGSLLDNRSVDFELPKGVKFKEGSIFDSNIEYGEIGNLVEDEKKFQYFTVDKFTSDVDEISEYTFEATLLVSNAFEGDEIVLTATGKALSDDHELVIAKVTKPVEVEVTPMDIKVGLRQQVGGKIVIKENAKEGILRNYTDENGSTIKDAEIEVRIHDGLNDGITITDADIKVTEGDLLLDLDGKVISDGIITIPVKRESTKPSTVEITNIEVTANRNVPEGKYDIKVGGAALSKNTLLHEFLNDNSFRDDFYKDGNVYSRTNDHNTLYRDDQTFMDPVAVKEFINITTKNTEDFTGTTAAKVAFVLGSNQYMVNGVAKEMDAAPFVKDGRTMVPVRYVAQALGVSEEQVAWDQATQTVTVIADKVIQVKLGSKTMVLNGANVPMTAAAELVSDRTFVPIAEIARALNVNVVWDDATKTATFN